MSNLAELEKQALCGDRAAVLEVVSALRKYRAAVEQALKTRWGDGAVDGYHASVLESTCSEIEDEAGSLDG